MLQNSAEIYRLPFFLLRLVKENFRIVLPISQLRESVDPYQYTIQINQPTRCISLSDLLPVV